jgi:hypothetical protein
MIQPNLQSEEAWRTIHQPFELAWWKEAIAAGHPGFDEAQRAEIKAFIKPRGRILDIGSGPRPLFRPCTVIEPLAEEYRTFVPEAWWSGVTIITTPAEQYIETLEKFDTILCWNALDHAVGWIGILDSVASYSHAKTRIGVSTDFFPPFVGHPGFERTSFEAEIAKRFNVIERREPFQRAVALLLEVKVNERGG